jgi:uncharacterized membrane protein
VALAVHIFGAVIWVGGMFAIYVCLRPALGTLDPPQRLRLMRASNWHFTRGAPSATPLETAAIAS